MTEVVKEVTPVPPESTEPPVAAAYQSIVEPDAGVAEIVTVPVLQRAALVAVGAAGGVIDWVVVIEAVAVQPFASVTVTVNVPADVIVAEELEPSPPLQL